MLKQKIDQYVRDFTTAEKRLTLTKSELKAVFEDIVRLTATAMSYDGQKRLENHIRLFGNIKTGEALARGYLQRCTEEKLTKERLLEEIKNV